MPRPTVVLDVFSINPPLALPVARITVPVLPDSPSGQRTSRERTLRAVDKALTAWRADYELGGKALLAYRVVPLFGRGVL